ncbi:hypothetical protein RF11_15549 [Thelohanellus kitauei]|uniref:Uncharacterized protein n=1 Tax=Thelohanellus kitauei TaxID=669202 RepID=A0A0C2J7F1_THEKT|nr:hypothetical protein RF11_15549 [Thelohanellus kitauei]
MDNQTVKLGTRKLTAILITNPKNVGKAVDHMSMCAHNYTDNQKNQVRVLIRKNNQVKKKKKFLKYMTYYSNYDGANFNKYYKKSFYNTISCYVFLSDFIQTVAITCVSVHKWMMTLSPKIFSVLLKGYDVSLSNVKSIMSQKERVSEDLKTQVGEIDENTHLYEIHLVDLYRDHTFDLLLFFVKS